MIGLIIPNFLKELLVFALPVVTQQLIKYKRKRWLHKTIIEIDSVLFPGKAQVPILLMSF